MILVPGQRVLPVTRLILLSVSREANSIPWDMTPPTLRGSRLVTTTTELLKDLNY